MDLEMLWPALADIIDSIQKKNRISTSLIYRCEWRTQLTKRRFLFALTLVLFYLSGAFAQYPIMDAIAGRIVQKYQTSTCEQLYVQKAEKTKPGPQEQKLIQMLQGDPQMRAAFISKVAPPIANKMFDCGMIP
jgi:hypothetical protein